MTDRQSFLEREEEKNLILTVDDSKIIQDSLKKALTPYYRVIQAMSGEEAIKKCGNKPDIILMDVQMPGMDGYETCRELKKNPKTASIPVIFVTGLKGIDDEKLGFDAGGVDYLKKPAAPEIIRARVKTHLELALINRRMEDRNATLNRMVEENERRIKKTQLEIIQSMGIAAEYRDPETGAHIMRMSHYSEAIARRLGLSEEECELILQASPLHDVGKIGTPDHVLLKPGKLDPAEWEIMKQHASIGAKMLAGSKAKVLKIAQQIAVSHHEKWDGSGYPTGLKGEKISPWGRIVAVADVFDALTSERPYKKEWPVDKAVELIKEERGKHFEPALVDIFMDILPKILAIKARFGSY